MGINQMRVALRRLDAKEAMRWSAPVLGGLARSLHAKHPIVTCVQWGGPWSDTRGASVYRHWIVLRLVDGEWLAYDVNAQHRVEYKKIDGTVSPHKVSVVVECRAGGWGPLAWWEESLAPLLIPQRGDGSWRIQWAAAVVRGGAQS